MNYLHLFCSILILLFCNGCQTFVTTKGKKHRQFFPATDKIAISDIDTSKFVVQSFSLDYYSNKVTHKNSKRVVQVIRASDVRQLASSKDHYIIFFWNPTCGATMKNIHILDRLSKKGENIIVVSLRNSFEFMDERLQKTAFSQYPLYVIDAEIYSKRLLVRQIKFIKESCQSCYEQYRDDLAVTDYLSLLNSTIEPIMHNNKNNIFLINH